MAAGFLDDDLGDEGLGAALASPSYDRSHLSDQFGYCRTLSYRSVGRRSESLPSAICGTTGTLEVRQSRIKGAKMAQNGSEMVRHLS
jgi:hypothetical protein